MGQCNASSTPGSEQLGDFEAELARMLELRSAAPLQHIQLRTILNTFRKRSAKAGSLRVEDMQTLLLALVENSGYPMEANEEESIRQICQVLDVNEDNDVSLYEALSMLPLFCGGEQYDNEQVLFELIDTDGNLKLDKKEFGVYLNPMATWVMKVLAMSPSQKDDLLAAITQQVFTDIDTNHDGNISLEEWMEWMEDHSLYVLTKEKLVKCM